MSRRLVSPSLARALGVAGVLVAFAAGLGALPGLERAARANGRPPATVSITFRQGHPDDIIAGLTFGTAISHDGGATWHWICEDALALPASSPYDPIYTYTPAGSVFATTTTSLIVMRDGCTFNPAASGNTFVSATTLGPDGAFYYAAAQTAAPSIPPDFQIYRSIDDGLTFPVHRQPDPATDTNVLWDSIAVAPSDKTVVYLTGFRYIPVSPGSTDTMRDHLLYRSDDGGVTWTPQMPPTLTGLTRSPNSEIHIAGIAGDDPKHVYARVSYIDLMTTDGLYVSTDAGVSWKQIHTQPDRFVAFVVRAAKNSLGKHDLLTATAKFGTEISHDDGMTWAPLAGAPHINCLTENAAGELWACTQNYGVLQSQSDDAGIMKTTDLSAWTKVLRYQDLVGPVAGCGADTVQQNTCNQSMRWCGVCAQLGCTPSASYVCPVAARDAPVTPKGGCCDTGTSPGGPLALALSVATLLWWPRRRLRSR